MTPNHRVDRFCLLDVRRLGYNHNNYFTRIANSVLSILSCQCPRSPPISPASSVKACFHLHGSSYSTLSTHTPSASTKRTMRATPQEEAKAEDSSLLQPLWTLAT